MGYIRNFDRARKQLADIYVSDRKRIESLRIILSREQGREVSFDEAQEIATDLVSFYRSLAQGKRVMYGGLKNKDRLREV